MSTELPPRRLRGLTLLAAAALVAGLVPSVFYVWGHMQIVTVGYKVEAARQHLRALEDEGRALQLERARLLSLDRVETEARRQGLAPAKPERVVIVRVAD